MIAVKKERRPIIWQPTEKQREFLSAAEREVLYGGSLGGGKSDACLACALLDVENPKHRAIYFRRSFPQLRSAIERSHELYRPLGGTYNVQTSTWIFPAQSRVEFAFLDSDSDKWRYAGRSFNCILWDELCEWENDAAYVYLLSRLRTTKGSGLRLMVRASANPLGPGASWVRARWQIPDDGGPSECVDLDTGFHRRFVPARIEDNVHLLGSDYLRMLQSQPLALRKALLLGRWDSVAGSIFEDFDHDVHTCDPFKVPLVWPRWRGGDDGFRAPFCSLSLIWDRDVEDTIYAVAEIYRGGMTPQDAAQAVLSIDRQLTGPDEPWSGKLDSAAFANVGASEMSRGEQMNSLGANWEPAEKGPGSIAAGLSEIHARLRVRSDGTVGLKIFRGCCPNLVRELTSLVYDSRHVEEYDPACSDHAVSALRYGLTHRPAWQGRGKVRF
jgi:Terminase large subunit, T4likevirus-type, N-terminal